MYKIFSNLKNLFSSRNIISNYKYYITALISDAGIVQFKKRGLLVKESVGVALIPVIRKQGSDGEIGVSWRTIDKKAVSGKDFIGGQGELKFKHGEVKLSLTKRKFWNVGSMGGGQENQHGGIYGFFGKKMKSNDACLSLYLKYFNI